MLSHSDQQDPDHLANVTLYIHMTKTVMPDLAKTSKTHWPVVNDHCFQRIVLDTVCDGVWYDKIKRPAYKHMDPKQALEAVSLCQKIISEELDLRVLNQQSLVWRGKKVMNR